MKYFVVMAIIFVAIWQSEGKFREKRQYGQCKDCSSFCNCLPEPLSKIKIPNNLRKAALAVRECERLEDQKWEVYEKCMTRNGVSDSDYDDEACPNCQKMKDLENEDDFTRLRRKRSTTRRRKRQAGEQEDEYEKCLKSRNVNDRDVEKFEDYMMAEEEKRYDEDEKIWERVEFCEMTHCGNELAFEEQCAAEAGLDPEMFQSYEDSYED